ncbi:MAG: ArnT family glycosyltransferase, partial [Anaerolineales bacterium]
VSEPAAWHLANFVTFLVGLYFMYGLARRFAGRWPAALGAAFFATQPLLWGHAFINPKDMPFMVFFLGSIWLGFGMVDRLTAPVRPGRGSTLLQILLPGVMLGLASANRVLGPLAGLFVVAYLGTKRPSRRAWIWVAAYGLLALITMVAFWPYLWESPFRFVDVFQFMSDNPTTLQVLFADHVYRAYDLPRRYLPFFLFAKLTEPVWPLFLLGVGVAAFRCWSRARESAAVVIILAWFAIPVTYVLIARPPLYDGMRHFLFILPPVFIFAAIALELVFDRIRSLPANAILAILLLGPGVAGILVMHPYEYAYFNSYVGGTGSVFRHFETDYWLTCYKEAVQDFDARVTGPVRLFVHREPDVAQPYAASNVAVLAERGALQEIKSGDFVLVNTRTNEDRQTFHDAPWLLSVGRAGATFCIIKGIP